MLRAILSSFALILILSAVCLSPAAQESKKLAPLTEGEREAAAKERLKPFLGNWTNHYHESRPRNAPCVEVDTSSQTLKFRPEGLQGPNLEGKGTYRERYAARNRPPCTGRATDFQFSYDFIVSYQANEDVFKYRQTVRSCSGDCGGVTIGQSTEGTIRLESPTVLVWAGVSFQKGPK